jgi:hypothetical protein
MARTLRVDEIYSSTGTISLPPGQGLDLSDCQSSLSLPRGTTVQEGTPVASGLRFDTDTGEFKSYGQSWNRFKNKVSRDYGNIVKAGLILELDTYRINSYPGSGNKWYSTTKKPITGTILGGPVFDSEEKYFTFDYANDRVDTTGFENYSYSSGITVSVWHYNGGGTG